MALGRCYAPVPTVPNMSQNVHECKKFEIRTHSCLGEHESCKFFIWARSFLDNSKTCTEPTQPITIYICEWTWITVRSKLDLLAYGTIVTRKQLDKSAHGRNSVRINTNVVKYGSFLRCTRKSTYSASMSKYGYDYQCEWQCESFSNLSRIVRK